MKLSPRLRALVKKQSLRTTFKITALLALASVPGVTRATQFTYTPPATPDTTNWSQGTAGHFNALPVSNAATELTFGANTTTALAAGSYTSNDDITTGLGTNGGFQLGILDLNGLGPTAAGTPATINITGTALEFDNAASNTLNLNGLAGTGGLVFNVNTGLILDQSLTVTGAGTGIFNFNGVISGTGALTKSGASTMTLTGANTYTGATTVNAGVVVLSGANGSLALSSTPITLNGGEFRLTNTAAAGGTNGNRIADTQAITVNGGGFLDYIGIDTAGSASSETVGAVTLGAGTAGLTGNQAQIAMNGTATNSSTLTLASLTRNAGGVVALVNGNGLGQDSTSNVQRVIVTAAPTLVGTTAALSTGINNTVQNTQIVPFLVGDVAVGVGGKGALTNVANTFLTYNATTGLRPLSLTDEFTANATTAGNNTYITANTTATTASVNSLVLAGAATAPVLTIGTGITLNDASGAVLFGGTATNKNFTVSGAGTLDFGTSEAIVTVNSGVTGVVSTAISGSGGFTKSGAGALTLSGTDTATGTFNLNQGSVTFTGGSNAFSTYNVNASTLTLNPASGATTFTAIPSTAAVNVTNGTFNVTFTGADGATKALVLPAFALNLSNSSFNFGGPNLDVATFPGAIALTGTNTFASSNIRDQLNLSGVISGTGNLVFNTSGAQNSHLLQLSGADTYSGSTTINSNGAGGSIQLAGGANRLPTGTTLTLNSVTNTAQLDLNGQNQSLAGLLSTGTLANDLVVNSLNTTQATLTLNIANGVTNTFSGGIGGLAQTTSGNGVTGTNIALTKTGTGTLVLSGTDGYTGATTVSAGALKITSAGAIVAASTVSVATGGAQIQFNTGADGATLTTAAFPLTLNGDGATTDLSFPANNVDTYNIGSPITLVNGSIIQGFGLINTYNFNGVISGTATTNGLVINSGGANTAGQANTFVLNAASTYTGNTTFNALSQQGILKLGITNALPTTTTLILVGGGSANSPASLELNGFSQTLAGLTNNNNVGGTRITNSSATASTLTLNNGATDSVAGILGGTTAATSNFAFSKTGGGAVILSGANTYTGGTTVAGSFFQMSGAGTLGATTNNLTINTAGGLDLNATNQTVNALSGTSTTAAIYNGSNNTSRLTVGNGNGSGSFGGLIVNVNPNGSTGTPVVAITKTGTGTQTFTGANTYSGGTIVSGGTLALGDGGTFGTGAVANSATVAFSNTGALTVGNVISGTGAVTQTTAGTTTLTGANTFTGLTTINAGTLSAASTGANKALGGTTGIAINSGTLSLATANQASAAAAITMGTATPTAGILSVAAGASQGSASTVTGGAAPVGTTVQGLGALTLNGTSTLTYGGASTTLVFGLFTPNSNVLSITGYSNGTATANGLNSGGAGDDRLVFSNGGGADAALTSFAFNGQAAGFGVTEIPLDGGFYEVAYMTAVPEPSTWVGGLLGLGVIGFAQRRRMGAWLGASRLS